MELQPRELLQQEPSYTTELEKLNATYPPDEDGYVRLETLSVYELNSTAQYTGKFIKGTDHDPALGTDLDIVGDAEDFTHIKIKLEDAPIFLGRVADYKKEQIAKLMGRLSQQ